MRNGGQGRPLNSVVRRRLRQRRTVRILDGEKQVSLHQVQLYFTPQEAAELKEKLELLLKDPEANEHEHLISDGREISFSVVTPSKLKHGKHYSAAEQKMFKAR